MTSAPSARKASIFFVAYTRDGTSDIGKRPVTFSFNGGPGSSSVWLHLGMFGHLAYFLVMIVSGLVVAARRLDVLLLK